MTQLSGAIIFKKYLYLQIIYHTTLKKRGESKSHFGNLVFEPGYLAKKPVFNPSCNGLSENRKGKKEKVDRKEQAFFRKTKCSSDIMSYLILVS